MSHRPRSVLYRSASTTGALALAAILAFSAAPAGVAQTTLLDVTVANPLFSDFEDGPQEWTANPGGTPVRPAPVGSWAWGAPTSGPGVAASGSNVWATNLAGTYGANECAGLATPVINLTGASSASISFKHWRHLEQSTATSTFVPDAGVIMATTDGGETFSVLSATGYTTNSLSSVIRPCFDGADTAIRGFTGPAGTTVPGPAYTLSSADLSAFAGQEVQVLFVFASNCCTHRAGWYVDDVETTVDGVTSVQDFESSDGGYTLMGTRVAPPVPLGWSHGVPTVGPIEPTAMWATNPAGDHGPNECAWVESPAIDLGPLPAEAGAVATATLSWLQWYRSSSTAAAGVVQVGTANGSYTIVEPVGGYPARPTSTVLDACLGHLAPSLGAYAGLIDPLNGPMTEFQADLTPWLGQTITIRYLFASTSSTSTNEGWYVDDVNVEVAATVVAPGVGDVDIPGLGGTNAPGWTSGGPVNSWAYGVTTATPANHTTYKTNLNGNYANLECSYIDSPPVPGALFAADPSLSFEHWHRIPGTSVNVPWAAGIVLVSGDGGVTWTHLDMSDYNKAIYQPPTYTEIHDDCLVNFGSDNTKGGYGKDSRTAVAGAIDGWYTSSADLSDYVGAPTVQVRFAFGSDGAFEYEGWAIRAVTLGGVKIL